MYYDYSRERGNDYIVDLLEERFIVKNINNGITINSVSDYIKSLSTSIEYWYYIHNPIEAKLNELMATQFVKVVSTCVNQEGFLVVVLYLKDHKNEKS